MSEHLIAGLEDSADWFLAMRDKGIDMLPTAHLKMAGEAAEAAAAPEDIVEVADTLICMVAHCLNQGWQLSDLADAVHSKMARNRARIWERTENGTWQHVRDEHDDASGA